MMPTPTTTKSTARGLSGLTGKGRAAVALIAIRDHWDSLSPSQRHEVAGLVERLGVALRREHSLAVRTPSPARTPLVGRIAS